MTRTAIIERIERTAGVDGLVEILAERIAASDLQSLLLEVGRRRAAARTPAQILRDYERDAFVRPSGARPAILARFERALLTSLPPAVEALVLSPVCPLGTCTAVAPIDPSWAVATVRSTEVVSDLTNVLALEAALRRRRQKRRRARGEGTVHLAASQRLLRGQRFRGGHQSQHFALFGLVSAARDRGTLRFELDALRMHLGAYLSALQAFWTEPPPLRLRLTRLVERDPTDLIDERLSAPLQRAFPDLDVGFDDARSSGRGYYQRLCVAIDAETSADGWLNLVDGGVVDWTQRLLSDAKERLVVSGIGSERVCTLFTPL